MRTTFGKNLKVLILFFGIFKLVASASWHTANDGHKYLIEKSYNYNWLQAHDECAKQNLQLATIENAAKNKNLDTLLRSVLGQSRNLWLGHHDAFNTNRDKNRPFFSAATGERMSFGNWSPNNPDNDRGEEHCAHVWTYSDYQWNDNNCANKIIGFICEEHHLTTKYRKDMDGKRKTVNQKNNQISSTFSTTQKEIKDINRNTQIQNEKIIRDFQKSTDEIIFDLKKSLVDIVRQKPYMEAIVADLGKSITEIVSAKENEFNKASNEMRESIQATQLSAESRSNNVNLKFSQELTKNTNEVDKILVF